MDCAKFFSYFFIILLLIFTLGCILIGILGCFAVDIVDGVGPSIALTVIGAVILLICILGFVGLRRQSPRLLWVFVGLSITMWVVSVGLHIANKHSDFEADLKKVVLHMFEKEVDEEGGMDQIQKKYFCCGITSVDDYTLIGRLPPKTCCIALPCDNSKIIWPRGCLKKALTELNPKYKQRSFLESFTSGGLFLCIVITTWMAIRFKEQKGRPNY